MTVADTSAWIDFARGTNSRAAQLLEARLVDGTLLMAMPVLFEILSGPGLTPAAREALLAIPALPIGSGFWERAGAMRQALLKKRLKARAMDCLVAQSCLDHEQPLIALDRDFRHFERLGLVLVD